MNNSSRKSTKVLFVDDQEEFLTMVKNLFELWSKGQWEVFLANNTGKALAIIKEQPIDLVVIDLNMPVVDGIQFLKLLHRKYPNLPKAMLTSVEDETKSNVCLNSGAELFLNKPATMDGMETVFANLNELVEIQTTEGFRGVMRRVGLQEIIQLECLGTKSSILEIESLGKRGRIYISDGQIVHAYVGDLRGEEAFNHLLGQQHGEFSLKPFTAPPEETIQDSWEMLLMEAARVNDESGESTQAPDLPTGEQAPLPWERDDFQPAPTLEKDEEAKEPALLVPETMEVVVCSPQLDVLFEYQCEQPERYIRQLEALHAASSRIRQTTPLGSLLRFEMQGPEGRLINEIQDEFSLVTRTLNSPLQSL